MHCCVIFTGKNKKKAFCIRQIRYKVHLKLATAFVSVHISKIKKIQSNNNNMKSSSKDLETAADSMVGFNWFSWKVVDI